MDKSARVWVSIPRDSLFFRPHARPRTQIWGAMVALSQTVPKEHTAVEDGVFSLAKYKCSAQTISKIPTPFTTGLGLTSTKFPCNPHVCVGSKPRLEDWVKIRHDRSFKWGTRYTTYEEGCSIVEFIIALQFYKGAPYCIKTVWHS